MGHQTFAQLLGNYGEFLGSIAVLATLIYVSVQVRQAKANAADTNRLNRGAGVGAMLLALATNDNMRNSVIATLPSAEFYEAFAKEFDVTVEDAGRVEFQAAYWFWLHWNQFASMTTEKDIAELRHLIKNFYTLPHMLFCWHNSISAKSMFDLPFVAFVEDVLSETEPD